MARSRFSFLLLWLVYGGFFQSCYMYDYFSRGRAGDGSSGSSDAVLGDDLGAKAGTRNEAALASVYGVTTTKAPAAIRPDPDMLARQILRQFRTEGTTLARAIGEVENYRLLLGGASTDFAVSPSTTYDATSVLAAIKVAEEICRSLVNPSSWENPGWSTILPSPVGEKRSNLAFLAQRMTGISTTKVSTETIDQLEVILNNSDADKNLTLEDYVNPCAAVVLDARAMLL